MKNRIGGPVMLVLLLGCPSLIFAQGAAQPAPEMETERDEQNFLFLLNEAYTQKQFEVQVSTGFEVLKGRFKEQEFEVEIEDGEEEIHVETKGICRQTLAMPLALEVGVMDWWELEVETKYREIRARSWEINDAGTKKTENISGMDNTELTNQFRLINEREKSWVPTVSAAMSLVFPTADLKDQELAENRLGYEWGLQASKRWQFEPIPGDLVTHAAIGFGIMPHVQSANEGLPDSKAHNLRGFSYGLATVWRFTNHWSLLLELKHELEEDIELNRRVSESSLVFLPGLSVRDEIRNRFEWELGAGFPIGLTPDANDWGFALKLRLEA